MSTVHISPDLSRYLEKKGLRHIIVDFAECKSCGGAIAEVFARAAKEKEAERVPEHTRVLEGDGVTVLVVKPIITIDDEVFLGIRDFLGIKDITLEGLRL